MDYAGLSSVQRFQFVRELCSITGCAKPEEQRSLTQGRLARQRSVYLVVSDIVERGGRMVRKLDITARGRRYFAFVGGVLRRRLR